MSTNASRDRLLLERPHDHAKPWVTSQACFARHKAKINPHGTESLPRSLKYNAEYALAFTDDGVVQSGGPTRTWAPATAVVLYAR